MRKLWKLVKERKGQSLVEYALILALVAIVVIAALSTLGQQAKNAMTRVGNEIGRVT
jgi:pilus assembly protein Flp/PilA